LATSPTKLPLGGKAQSLNKRAAAAKIYPVPKPEIEPFCTVMPFVSFRAAIAVPEEQRARAAGRGDRETSEVDDYEIRRKHQTVALGGEIICEFISTRLTDRLSCLDQIRFSRICPRRENYCREGERNWK
jgi:hypothetical protein